MSFSYSNPFSRKARWGRLITTVLSSFVLVFSMAGFQPAGGVEADSSIERFSAHLDQRIPGLMESYSIPGATIALIKDGQLAWMNAYGYADLETGRRMTTDTYLRVQSISKSVTAWGVMNLVEQGLLELDRPVQDYLKHWQFPDSEFHEEKITTAQLLSHCAGMPLGDFFNMYAPTEAVPSLADSLSKEAFLIHEPGSAFAYSNTGYNLLELLIEEITGRDFSDYMQQAILIPLGMHHATYRWSETLEPAVPIGYNLSGAAVPVYVYPEKGSGGLFASVEAIAAFVAAGMPNDAQNQPVLSADSIAKLYTPMAEQLGVYSLVFDGYGLGHYLETLPGGQQAVAHGGQGTGWMTHFQAVPETGDGIVILTNSQRSWPLIAYLVTDWAQWRGFGPIGMSRIILGKNMLWVVTGLIWFFVLWQAWNLIDGLARGILQFSPGSAQSCFLRMAQGGMGFLLFAGLLWCTNQDYLFISSLFPIAARGFGIALSALAATLLVTALLPRRERTAAAK